MLSDVGGSLDLYHLVYMKVTIISVKNRVTSGPHFYYYKTILLTFNTYAILPDMKLMTTLPDRAVSSSDRMTVENSFK